MVWYHQSGDSAEVTKPLEPTSCKYVLSRHRHDFSSKRNLLTGRIGRRKAEQRKVGTDVLDKSNVSRRGGLKDVPLHERIDLNDMVALRTRHVTSNEWQAAADVFNRTSQSPFVSIRSKNSCQRWYEVLLENRLVDTKDLAERIQYDRDNASMYQLPADHLISLVYYNVYRAMITNMGLLGLDLNLMYSDDYPSPFPPLSPSSNSRLLSLPPTLQPTELQKTVAHHPQWDVLPDAQIRDNILRYGEDNIDDLQLCLDMVGGGNYVSRDNLDTQEINGLIVWGEPWDISGWEVTESFARKWSFIFKGAFRFQRATNSWRVQRGEEPLNFDKILEVE